MKSKRLSINGLRLHVNFWGEPQKPALFLFHGWMDLGASFEFLCRHLQKDFYCIAPDLRGFGKSEHSKTRNYFFYEYVADTHELFRQLSPDQPVNVLGHSMGGNIISLFAGAFPERVARFINVEGFGIQDMPPSLGPKNVREWLEGEIHEFRVYERLEEIALRLQKTNPRLEDKKALFLARHLCRKVPGGFQIAADPKHKLKGPYLFQMRNVIPFWENIQAPCLQVIGEESEMEKWLPSDEGLHQEIDRRLKYFPHSRKVVIPQCGHMVHHEKPELLAGLVRDFLREGIS